MNEEKFNKMLDHYRKYTLTSEEIIKLSDWEWDLHIKDSKEDREKIEVEFRQPEGMNASSSFLRGSR